MRKVALAAVLVTTWLSPAPLAQAQEQLGTQLPACADNRFGPKASPEPSPPNGAICYGTTGASNPAGPSAPNNDGTNSTQRSTSSRVTSNPVVKYVPYDRVTTDPDGKPCVTTGYYAEGTPPSDSADVDPVTQNVRDIHNLPPLEYPPCPARPQVPGSGEPEPVETPSMIARRYWEEVVLPEPQPSISPGRAITGKLAYLETKGQTTRVFTNETIVGPLRINATGSYTVDWGDGQRSGPFAFEGVPWPDGAISHEYSTVGHYDIVVTENWTATWALGGQSGVLRTLQTRGSIANFPVEQIQAVIVR